MLDEIPIEDQYVFTSLRYDGSMKRNAQNPVCCPESKAAYLIKYHYERLVTAADHLGWYDTNRKLKGPVDLFNRIQAAVTEHKKKTGNKCPFKVWLISDLLSSFGSNMQFFYFSDITCAGEFYGQRTGRTMKFATIKPLPE